MIFVNSEQLKSGMVIAKDINIFSGINFNSTLLTKGQALNITYINKIINHNISGIYIEDNSLSDVTIEPLINDNIKVRTLNTIKNIFSQVNKGVEKLNEFEVTQISDIVVDLTDEVIATKNLSFNMTEFKNHDYYTYQHSLSVSVLSILTGISLNMSKDELHKLGMSAMFHDIGKMIVPIDIINKPGKLTNQEFEVIKSHPITGVKLLGNLVSDDILSGIESHHECLDGSGYPYGKKNISLFGRIIAICDVYDALTSERSYRNACIPNEAIEYLMGCSDTKFDYDILSNFLKNIIAYPVGSIVNLSNGITSIVIKNYPENIMRPLVQVLNLDNTAGSYMDLFNDAKYMNITIVDRNI